MLFRDKNQDDLEIIPYAPFEEIRRQWSYSIVVENQSFKRTLAYFLR